MNDGPYTCYETKVFLTFINCYKRYKTATDRLSNFKLLGVDVVVKADNY